jgi:hypothetical protein
MAEFLELLETVRAEEADVRKLFSNDGEHRAGAPRINANDAKAKAKYQQQFLEAVRLVESVVTGKRHPRLLMEAMTTSDFPALFADVIDRTTLGAYRTAEANWTTIASRRDVRDFRPARIYEPRTIGGDSRLDVVKELEEYPESKMDEQGYYTLTIRKYGRRMGFSWETLINDDLNELTDAPQRLGQAARETENLFAVELYVDANGPHATLYSAGNKNKVVQANGAVANNPPLSLNGLQDGLTVLANQKDASGKPILLRAVRLVVPPALEVVAQNILNAVTIRTTIDGFGGGREAEIANWMRNRVTLEVNYLIPFTATTANGNTSWFLFAAPEGGRAALTMAFLRGRGEPELWEKLPNARRVGGGTVAPEDGDFDTDSRTYRVRHVLGGMRLDPKFTVASNGTGV